MKEKKEAKRPGTEIKRVIIISIIFMIAACVMIFLFCIHYSYRNQTNINSSLVSSICSQTSSAAENYKQKLEGIAKNVFSHKEYVEYDSTASYSNSYNRAALETQINDYLTSVSLMDEYASFGIIYRDNHKLGVISNSTAKSLSDEDKNTYNSIEKKLSNKNQMWYSTAEKENEILFFRRANKNAVFVISFYKSNLKNILSYSLPEENVAIYLTNENYKILYSTDKTDGMLDSKYLNAFEGSKNCVVTDFGFTASIKPCFDDWNTVVVLNLDEYSKEYKRMIISCAGILISSMIIMLLIIFLAVSAKGDIFAKNIPVKLDAVDKLTGMSNAETAENLIADKIERCATGSTIMLALVSIENYKLIKESYRQDGADDALLKTAHTLTAFYGENNIVGKLGENEFVIFADFTQYDLFAVHNNIKNSLKDLEIDLAALCLDNDRGSIKYSIGAAVYPDNSSDYDELYECAKKALETSSQKGGGHYELYQPKRKEKK